MNIPVPCVTFLNDTCPYCQNATLELKKIKNGFYELSDHFKCPSCKRMYTIRWEAISNDVYKSIPEYDNDALNRFVSIFGK